MPPSLTEVTRKMKYHHRLCLLHHPGCIIGMTFVSNAVIQVTPLVLSSVRVT